MSRIKITGFVFFLVITGIFGGFYGENIQPANATTSIYQMSDTIASSSLSTYSGRQIQAEYVTSTSSLVGKSIDTIIVGLQKVKSPTGAIQVGVFNSDRTVKQLFGTIDSTIISTSKTDYTFSLPTGQSYKIQSGDRIGIKFTGGSASKYVSIMLDGGNHFDGKNSYQTYYTNSWKTSTGDDLYMTLLLHVYTTSPGAPTGLTPTAGDSQISLSWTAPASNGGSPITGYNIYRSTTSGTEGSTPVTTVDPATTTYDDIGLTNGQQYFYTVSAVNSVGTSSASTASSTPVSSLIVSASPPGETYSSSQSVTLTASAPGTIYYTTDGSTPTTSSTNGPSPLSITVGSTSTLKFFAKDGFGNISPVMTQVYTISISSTVEDTFGITKLYQSITNGREWYANWSTKAHTILSGDFDPYDPQFQARGDGDVKVNGDGTASMTGSAPRMYVQDPTLKKLWNNVEITFYGKRVSDTLTSWAGLEAGARSGSHDDVTYPNVCTDSTGYPNTAYNGRITYDGRVDYEKEVLYHRGDATSYGSGIYPSINPAFANLSTPVYSSSGYHSMPFNTWIGYKFIVQSTSKGVHMETWMDMTNGTNGGTWIKMNGFDDNGGWSVFDWYSPYRLNKLAMFQCAL